MLFDRILLNLEYGLTVADALRVSMHEAVAAANSRLVEGAAPDDVLEDEGLREIPGLLRYLAPTKLAGGMHKPPIVQIVLPGDDLDGMPDPTCVARNLPKGRMPTRDEIRAAWRKCQR